jgi:hypothetical protein
MRLLYSCGKDESATPTPLHRRCRRYLARSRYPLPSLSLAPAPSPRHLVPRHLGPAPSPAIPGMTVTCTGPASGIPPSWPPVTVKP